VTQIVSQDGLVESGLAVLNCENAPHHILVDGNTEGHVIGCAIRGQPQRVPAFQSTTAAMTSWLVP
jgi:hypothetical protein